MKPLGWIWMSGTFVPWEEARCHVLSHGLHHGTAVFEGIRCYDTARGPALFRHRDHLARLMRSAELYYLPIRWDIAEIRAATHELIRRNGVPSCYVRPLAFRGYGEMGLYAEGAPVELVIAAWRWPPYLGERSKHTGVRAKISSWRRISPSALIPQAKASGQYLNSVLAKTESAHAGYDEAILLDERGFVSEGSAENVFIVQNGRLITPPHTASILDGVSRRSVIAIARDLGYRVDERDIARAELYAADDVFLCGTAAEFVPVRSIDDHELGDPGDITRSLQGRYEDALHGRAPEYGEWLDHVAMPDRHDRGDGTGATPTPESEAEVASETADAAWGGDRVANSLPCQIPFVSQPRPMA